jgi:hypothetical protein
MILELSRYCNGMWILCGRSTRYKGEPRRYFALLRGGSHHFRLPAAWKMNHPFG